MFKTVLRNSFNRVVEHPRTPDGHTLAVAIPAQSDASVIGLLYSDNTKNLSPRIGAIRRRSLNQVSFQLTIGLLRYRQSPTRDLMSCRYCFSFSFYVVPRGHMTVREGRLAPATGSQQQFFFSRSGSSLVTQPISSETSLPLSCAMLSSYSRVL